MREEEIKEKYRLSRQAYLSKQDLITLLGLKSQKLQREVFCQLREEIQLYLANRGKELHDTRHLPTDLVFKFLDNQQVLKQIEKDYADLMKMKRQEQRGGTEDGSNE